MKFDVVGIMVFFVICGCILMLFGAFSFGLGRDAVRAEAVLTGHAEYELVRGTSDKFTWLDHNEEEK